MTSSMKALALAAASILVACGGGDDKGGGDKPAAAAAESGCGKDYADPAKQFCLTLPAGYTGTPDQLDPKDELYSEIIRFKGPNMGDGVDVTVGFSSTNWKVFEDELKMTENLMKSPDRKVEGTGPTAGGTGKWWVFSHGALKTATAVEKAPNGKALMCTTSNGTPSPAAIETCKTLRPYPGGK
jgi:hypothetical protein